MSKPPLAPPTLHFFDRLKNLPPHRRKAAAAALRKYRENPDRGGLNFEKLDDSNYSIRSNGGDRIILHLEKDDEGNDVVVPINVGTHDKVYKQFNRQ